MAPKKKKKSKKKKKKQYDPPVYQIPIYEDPDVVTPKVQLTIKHHQMDIPNDAMILKLTMLISAPVSRVAKAISRHHQESISDVIICKDKYDPVEALPHEFTLEKCGITGPEAKLFYDYVPFTYPLIGMSIKSPEYYLRRLNQIPQSAKQILHEIRKLDREVSTMQIQINKKREDVIKSLLLYEERKDQNSKSEIEEQLKSINRIHKRMLKLTRKKKQLTQKLYNIVDDPTQQLERDLSNIIPIQTQASRKQHKGRRSKKDAGKILSNSGEQYFNSEPCYCYCKSPSFGLMVKCENQKCDTQWFHTHCLEDKDRQFEGKWYCRDCRKVRENRRSG